VRPKFGQIFIYPLWSISASETFQYLFKMPPNARHSVAHQRENTKQVIVVQEAGKLHTDPTYVDSDAEGALHSCNTLFDCTFYPVNPTLPVYCMQTTPSTQPSSSSLKNVVLSIQFKHISSSLSHDLKPAQNDVTCASQDFVLSAQDNPMQVDQGSKDAKVSY
jgi:hypothetical protein